MGCCRNIAKSLLIIINVASFISGIIILITSCWTLFSPSSFFNIISEMVTKDNKNSQAIVNSYHPVLYILMCIGIALIALSILACFGTFYDKKYLLSLYILLIIIILLVEIAMGLFLIMYQREIDDAIQNWLINSIKYDYNLSKPINSVTYIWDKVFSNSHCCGINSSKDFENSVFSNQTTLLAPLSCCDASHYLDITSCNEDAKTILQYYKKGCLDVLSELMMTHRNFIGGIALMAGALEIVIIISGIVLVRYTDKKEVS